jgi:peptide methionine sulfoxide reductase msrA/msrB
MPLTYRPARCEGEVDSVSSYRELSPFEKQVIIDKGTERPFSGKYNDFFQEGNYVCRQCGAVLYSSKDKFKSGCGWPAFDDQVGSGVERLPDKDGRRTEIVCSNCKGHLGHVFEGEGLTEKNTRHCVNSVSVDFVPLARKSVVVAGGCFWGVEYWLSKLPGVLETTVGYTGGEVKDPTYKQVCSGDTGHIEAVEVVYSPSQTNVEEILKIFFETHDPTQKGRQGPDVGEQYSSVIFYEDAEQKKVAENLIEVLEGKGLDVVTELRKLEKFYSAEGYHQDYYLKKGSTPYCHSRVKRF